MSEYEFVTGWVIFGFFLKGNRINSMLLIILRISAILLSILFLLPVAVHIFAIFLENVLFVGSSDGIVAKYISSELEHEKFRTFHDRYIILKKKFPIVQVLKLNSIK
ncbi:hypothetical protein MXB_2099 [Myxobolus squamalis]|nr:hypothetical protein MXB_2099 [Myxobolus squamalis]